LFCRWSSCIRRWCWSFRFSLGFSFPFLILVIIIVIFFYLFISYSFVKILYYCVNINKELFCFMYNNFIIELLVL
jgi:hypothetical protein